MEVIEILNRIIRISFINVFTYIVFENLINISSTKNKKRILILLISILETIIYIEIAKYIGKLLGLIILYMLHSSIIAMLTANKMQYSITITLISLAFSYIVYIISILISCSILKVIIPTINNDNIAILFLGVLIEGIILKIFFGMKRFKNGISFLKDKEKVNNIGIMGIIFSGIILIIFSLVDLSRGNQFKTYSLILIFIEAILIITWIKHKITKHYKQNLKENTVKELEDIIKEKDKEINRILEENNKIATINHKYSSRIKALENASAKIMSKPEFVNKLKEEFGEDFGNLEKQINI